MFLPMMMPIGCAVLASGSHQPCHVTLLMLHLEHLVAGELFPERLQDKTASCQVPFLPVVAEPELHDIS